MLRGGAKDDPDAREHFLNRLAQDTDRVSRLTESLLTLARMEAVGEGGASALDVAITMKEAAQAVSPPDGITLRSTPRPSWSRAGTPCCCARC